MLLTQNLKIQFYIAGEIINTTKAYNNYPTMLLTQNLKIQFYIAGEIINTTKAKP